MYLRWQSRKRERPQFGWQGQDTRWSAVIVETARIGGKPKQRHVAYLVGFTESAIKIDAQRCHLWDHISARLDQLGNQITPDDREKIEAAIAKKVRRPTVAEYKEVARDCVQILGWRWISDKQRAALQDESDLNDLIGTGVPRIARP
jgi:hypothetical protein